jgi:phosphoglucomutase
MNVNALYTQWLAKAAADPDLIAELAEIKGSESEISDRFYRELEFGTGGLRGVIGAGTNRMNVYTVGKATQGLANYVKNKYPGDSDRWSVAVAYDSRIKSDYFSESAAAVLAANGMKVYIYPELMPTPMLSFAVRALNCHAGINVTASHNPSKYNGYKVYNADGCQVTDEAANAILAEISQLDIFEDVKTGDFKAFVASGRISYITDDVSKDYFTAVKQQSIHPELCAKAGLKVVYTPLNGAGNKPVRKILADIGITDVTVVPEQENPDGNFTTCPYPNPEIKEALQLGLKLCEQVKPDLLLATDPDCDRVGIAVPDPEGGYTLFSGNETGAMLLEYIARERTAVKTMPENPVAVKSIVTTTLADKICEEYGVTLVSTLTGFKYIGEQVGFLEKKGEENRYIFGFEESYGYLAGTYARDKDAVVGAMLICEMAAFYRSQGISLYEARNRMYERYGFYLNALDSFAFEGAAGMAKMKSMMNGLRQTYPKIIVGKQVITFTDYLNSFAENVVDNSKSPLTLPKSDVIVLSLEGGASIVIRPSGTEPKIKIYWTTVGKTMADARAQQKEISAEFKSFMGV